MTDQDEIRESGIIETVKNGSMLYKKLLVYGARDTRLAADTRGTLWYLLSCPKDWQVRTTNVMKAMGFGRDVMRRVLKQLEEFGYLKRVCTKLPDGRYHWKSLVYEIPEKELEALVRPPDFQATVERSTANPSLYEQENERIRDIRTNESNTNSYLPSEYKSSDAGTNENGNARNVQAGVFSEAGEGGHDEQTEHDEQSGNGNIDPQSDMSEPDTAYQHTLLSTPEAKASAARNSSLGRNAGKKGAAAAPPAPKVKPLNTLRKDAYSAAVTGKGFQTTMAQPKDKTISPFVELEELNASPDEISAAVDRAIAGWDKAKSGLYFHFWKVPDAVRSLRGAKNQMTQPTQLSAVAQTGRALPNVYGGHFDDEFDF